MQIHIRYESKYSLGTVEKGVNILLSSESLKPDNSEHKNFLSSEKNYFENMQELNKVYKNFKYVPVTLDTILGILCRLVGDVRRLDEIKLLSKHPILDIKDSITFEDINRYYQNELISLHTPLKESKNGAGGVIIFNSPLISKNDFSERLLSVFNYKTHSELANYILKLLNKDPDIRNDRYKKDISLSNIMHELCIGEKRSLKFKDEFSKILNARINNLYGLLLYKKIEYFKYFNDYNQEIDDLLTEQKKIPGISETSGYFTKKDFYGAYQKEKKVNWILPYSITVTKPLFKKDEKMNFNAKVGVTKEGGDLFININTTEEKEQIIKNLIEEAGVNTFYLGKKGLAYVVKIKDGDTL